MSKIKVIENELGDGIITIEEHTASRCTVTGDPMQLDIFVAYMPSNKMLEFTSFRRYVNDLASRTMHTIESFTKTVFEELERVLSPIKLLVVVKAVSPDHGIARAVKTNDVEFMKLFGDKIWNI